MQRITITANDGKEFYGTVYDDVLKEVNAYEADQELKKKAELERRKKAEEERRRVEETEATLLKELNAKYTDFACKAKEFEKATGKRLIYTYNNVTKDYELMPVRNTLDFAYDSGFKRLLNILNLD
jgi:hypothetical protein